MTRSGPEQLLLGWLVGVPFSEKADVVCLSLSEWGSSIRYGGFMFESGYRAGRTFGLPDPLRP